MALNAGCPSEAPGVEAGAPDSIRDVFSAKCYDCHSVDYAEAGLELDELVADLDAVGNGRVWEMVLRRVRAHEMPPEDGEPLPGAERAALVDWVEQRLETLAEAAGQEPTPQLRRLTKAQYSQTLSELLGLPIDFALDLPADAKSRMGFTNAVGAQQSSPLRLEYYQAIARRALGTAIVTGERPERTRLRVTIGEWIGSEGGAVLFPGFQTAPIDSEHLVVELLDDRGRPADDYERLERVTANAGVCMRGSHANRFRVTADGLELDAAKPHVERPPNSWRAPSPNMKLLLRRHFPATGPVTVRVTARPAAGEDAGRPPRPRAFIGSRTDDGIEYSTLEATATVASAIEGWRTYEYRGYLENLPIPVVDLSDDEALSNILVVGVWNDRMVTSRKAHEPRLVVRSIEFDAPAYEQWPPASHRAIFFDSELREADPDAYVRELLGRFLGRAFRRPVSPEEVDRYFDVWLSVRDDHASLEEGVQEVLVAALCSPHFVYLDLPRPQEQRDFALASRLSYFLWNGPPDAELLELAERGDLVENLGGQVERMLRDERAWRFVETFCREWLRIDRHEAMATSARAFPEYNRFVKRAMTDQTAALFREVLVDGRPVDDLIDPDYAMLNEHLAAFYGVSGVTGMDFRRVGLSERLPSGGLLTQGAMLNGHSDGVHSHPIKRAVWLRERVLGDPPPPPPPNVPELPEAGEGIEELTLKERLELHRDKASCRDCHRAIDPYGVVFERYDAVGRRRDDPEIDASSVLPDGTELDGVEETKRYVLGPRRTDFVRSLAKHLYSYATGQEIEFRHRAPIERIVRRTLDDPRLATMVHAVVESDAFLDTGVTPTQPVGGSR